MSELAQPTDADPFSPDYWRGIDWGVERKARGLMPVNMKKSLGPRLMNDFNKIEDGRLRGADRTYRPGEIFDPEELPEETFVAFEREYFLSAGDQSEQAAQAMLEEISVTQMGLVGTTTSHTADGFFDAGTGVYWKMRHEVQTGTGLVFKPDSITFLLGLKEIKRPALSQDKRRMIKNMMPLGIPQPPMAHKIKYEFINFLAPVNVPCRVGVSNEAPPFGEAINPYQRRIERINSVRIWAFV